MFKIRHGKRIPPTNYTHLDSGGAAFALKHFSVDEVFSYKVVDRRGTALPLGPTVRLPIGGSYLDVILGLAGLELASLWNRVLANFR